MKYSNNFVFGAAGTVNLAVGAGSTNVAIASAVVNEQIDLRIANVGSQVVFVRIGSTNAVVAVAATDIPILPNTVELFRGGGVPLFVAAIAAAVGSTLYITPGRGS